jgi:hypothetical protein
VSSDVNESMEQLLIRESPVYVENQGTRSRTQIDILTGVTEILQGARWEARGLNDKQLLYFIDMALFHAWEVLTNESDLGEREKWR